MSNRTIGTFQKAVTTAGTRVALSATALFTRKAKIKAHKANTGLIYIGTLTVSSTTGYVLQGGEEIDFTELMHSAGDDINLANIYIDSSVNGEGVSVIYTIKSME